MANVDTIIASRTDAATLDLQRPGAVLLVSCYELGHQPLNLAFPNAYLRESGYSPRVVDTSVDALTDQDMLDARLIAFSVPMHTALRLGTQLAERARRVNPEVLICFYGLYAWLNADYLLKGHADFVIGGEFEQPLVDLCRAVEQGIWSKPIIGVSGREFRAAPSIQRTSFPLPLRETLPELQSYAHLLRDGQAIRAGYTETTRGCHHTCLHCPVVPVYHGRFFAIPREVVMADIRQQVLQGAGHITFGDPDFLNGPTHSLRICRELHAEFPHVTFDMTTRIEHILEHRDLMPEFGQLGCVFAVSAVESVSETILERIDKGHTKQDIVEALKVLDAAGIAMRPSLLPFTPWTTLDDYLELLTFIQEYDLIENVDPVHLSIRLLVPPGSALLERAETVDWLGELDEAGFTYRWANPDPRLDELQLAVARTVEAADRDDLEPRETFERIKELAWGMAGLTSPAISSVPQGTWRRPPRLTESWFC